MIIKEFRYITKNDPFDDSYPHWSRKYEYPTILHYIEKYRDKKDELLILHNACCGFDNENHFKFIHQLKENIKGLVLVNSDIKTHFQTFEDDAFVMYYDITQPTPINWKNNFNAVLCISAIEEIPGDHIQYIEHLYEMVHPGGFLYITFDVAGGPGTQGINLTEVEAFVGKELVPRWGSHYMDNELVGTGAPWFNGLHVGLLIIQKEKS